MSTRSATAWIALFAFLVVAGLRLMDDGAATEQKRVQQTESGGRPGQVYLARVLRVVDGDTIKVQIGDRRETVRYIGVDTPETVKPGSGVQCYGKQASGFNRKLVDARNVKLTLDRDPRDRYGRLLAYVSVDGKAINEALLQGGFARTIEIPPNVARAARFRRFEARAQADGRGLWSACQLTAE